MVSPDFHFLLTFGIDFVYSEMGLPIALCLLRDVEI